MDTYFGGTSHGLEVSHEAVVLEDFLGKVTLELFLKSE